jgi:ketosteroid isomerase-like protein
MSQENVEVVRRLVALTQEGLRTDDLRGAMDESVAAGLISPTCEWRGGRRGGDAVVGVGDEVGPERIVEFIRTWTEDFSDFTLEVEDVIEADENRVVVIQRQSGTGKASGAPVDLRTASIFTLGAGQVVRIAIFLDPAKALQAAGLRE